ncbi:unnamed protein product [Paramecium octaurelia]|uniref:G patch domain-containing protein n=1 Tax=Paramecium octaurelia TaxID=43137 RepID=A0A8S1ULA2_PAROT|nr:unnamed protein product [Paramecium octaurelia]
MSQQQSQQIRNHFLDKKLIGTLFEEEEITKKDNFYNMEARDEKGHKRFHGAFEGGFEAGFKNTVGSKQGWAPQKFISSRTNRAKYNNQTIKDYMDEDDIGRQKLGVNVTIQPEYDTFGQNEINFLQQQLGSGSGWLLGSAPEELIYRDNKSVGYQVLMRLRKQMIKKRNTNVEQEKQEPSQGHNLKYLNSTNNQYTGLGYKQNIDTFGSPSNPLEQAFWTFIKQNASIIIDEDEEKRKKDNRIKMNGFTSQDKEEEYNNTIEDDDEPYQNKRKQVKGALDIGMRFTKDMIPLRIDTKDYLINVPEDYDPYHKAKKLLDQGKDYSFLFINKTNFKKPASSSKREEIFREEETASSIKRDISKQKFVKGSNQTMLVPQQQPNQQEKSENQDDINILNLFPHQPDKQQRYAYFVRLKLNKVTQEQFQIDEEEKVDFERLYQMFQVTSKNVIEKKQEPQKPAEQQEKPNPFLSQRVVKRWIPEDLFCKRMGVPQPYNDDEKTMIEKINERSHQKPNMATNNRNFLFMDKKEFKSGGFMQPQEFTQSQAQFDPVALGLPLSFKSHSYERNQQERLLQLENMERAQTQVVSKQEKRNIKFSEDKEDMLPSRIQDQNIFEFIFGDDEEDDQQ